MGGILNRSASFLLRTARGGTFYLLLSVLLGNPSVPRSLRCACSFPVCRKKRKICSSAGRGVRRNETIMYLQAVEAAEYKYTQPASRINSPAVIAGARDSNVTNRENILGFQPRILCDSVSFSLFPLFHSADMHTVCSLLNAHCYSQKQNVCFSYKAS